MDAPCAPLLPWRVPFRCIIPLPLPGSGPLTPLRRTPMAATASHVCLDSAKRIALCAIASFLLCHAALCESPFNLTSIPNTPAFTGVSINNNGQVVGTIIVDPNSRETQGLLWSRTAGAQTITIGDSSSATGINDSGQVVGYTKSGGGLPQAFLWQAGAGAQMINVPGSDGGSYANAISNAGAVIGNTGYPDAGAFIWSASQGAQPLLSQYEDVYPYSINAASQVAGQYTPIPGNQYLAFFWSENNGVED